MKKLLAACLIALCGFAVSASAELQITTDGRSVAFGAMKPGETKTLSERGAYHNQITCTSTGGSRWYLRIDLTGPLGSGANSIPLDSFAWHLVDSNGTGTIHATQFTPFATAPLLAYTAGADELQGRPVTLQFRYQLRLPSRQVAGTYNTTIRYTISEEL